MRSRIILLVGLLAATTALGQLTNGVPTGYAVLLVKTNADMNTLMHPAEMITNGMDSSVLTGCPAGAVPTNRILTINGVDHTLDFNRAWTIDAVTNSGASINSSPITNGASFTVATEAQGVAATNAQARVSVLETNTPTLSQFITATNDIRMAQEDATTAYTHATNAQTRVSVLETNTATRAQGIAATNHIANTNNPHSTSLAKAATAGNFAGTETISPLRVVARYFGLDAGLNVTGTGYYALGENAAKDAVGKNGYAVGGGAGQESYGENWLAVGSLAGYSVYGYDWMAIGNRCGFDARGDDWIAVGLFAGYGAVFSNSVVFGRYAGYNAIGNGRMYLDAYENGPLYDPDGSTNDTIFMDSNGKLYLGGGPSRAENPNAGGLLRGVWDIGTPTGNAASLTNFPPLVVQTNATELGNWQIANTGELSGAWSVLRPLRTGGAILDSAGGYVGLFTPTSRNIYNTGTVIVASHADVLRAYDSAGANGVAVQESITNHAQRIGALESGGSGISASTATNIAVAVVAAATQAIDSVFLASKGGVTNLDTALSTLTETNITINWSAATNAYDWQPAVTAACSVTFGASAAGRDRWASVRFRNTFTNSVTWAGVSGWMTNQAYSATAPTVSIDNDWLINWRGTGVVVWVGYSGAARGF